MRKAARSENADNQFSLGTAGIGSRGWISATYFCGNFSQSASKMRFAISRRSFSGGRAGSLSADCVMGALHPKTFHNIPTGKSRRPSARGSRDKLSAASHTDCPALTTSVSYHDNAQGNAVVTVDNSGDTITLVGVHASELHPSNFHFVDPAALPAIATTAQMVADLHAHNIL